MNSSLRIQVNWRAGCGTVLVLVWALLPATAQTNLPATNRTATVMPPVPKLQSSIARFRGLLLLNPVERNAALTNWSAEKRENLLASIREYSAMTAEEREARLNATELYWYLTKLLPMNPTNRVRFLPDVPEAIRPMVESRFAQWDMLSEATQQEILQNVRAYRLLSQRGSNSVDVLRRSLDGLPVSQRLSMQIKLAHFDTMSDAQRSEAFSLFNKFFELSPEEKERTLQTLSDAERVEMEKTLNTFASLPPDKRAQCVRMFEKFAGMSPAERGLFRKNAQQWEQMSPSERAAWRNLVNTVKIMPPLPYPRVRMPPPPVPPQTGSGSANLATDSPSTPDRIPGR